MTIENLQIEVQATSEQAATSLERLEAVLKRIDALGNSTGFDKLYRKLKKLASLDFSGTEAGLGGIAKTADRVSRTTSRMDKFTKTIRKVREEVKATSEEYSKFGKVSAPLLGSLKPIVPMSYTRSQSGGSFQASFGGNIGDGSPNWTQWNPWGSKQMFDNMFDAWSRHDFGNVPTSHRLTDGTIELGADQWRELSKFESLFSNLKSRIRDTIRSLKDFGSTVDSTDRKTKKVNKTFGAMKTILMYSLLFSAVSAVTKGVSEGLQNVAMYSKEANAVLTEYKTLGLELKNSIGAALIPVLQALYPLIKICADVLIDAANAVNVFIAAVSGADSFRKAKKYTDDYAKSLGKVKGMVGMDQIHTLSKSYDYGEMFEDVKLDGWSFVSSLATLTEIVAVLNLIKFALTGKWLISLPSLIASIGSKLKGCVGNLKNLGSQISPVTKKLIGAAGLVIGFIQCKNAAYDLTKALGSGNKDGLGSSIMSLVTGGAMAIAGGAMIGGPVGALIGACVALVGALLGVSQAQVELKLEMEKTEYYDIQGRKIAEVKDALNNYFAAMDFDKQAEWIQTMTDAQTAYDDARVAYDLMWESIANKTVFDASDIEGLAQAFNDLADAANAVNEANIGSLMASIRTGIELNITDALSDKLGGLLDKIREAQLVLGQKVTNLSQEYQSVLNEITANGGVATPEQKEKLQSLRNDIAGFTLSSDSSTERWNIEIDEALKNAINAGSDKNAVLSNIQDLMTDRDNYLTNLKDKYSADRHTLSQLIEMDKNQFGGQLGFSSADLDTLDASYAAQIEEVKRRYNQVLQQVINTYEKNAVWNSGESYEMLYDNGFLEGMYDIGKYIVGIFDSGYVARSELAREQAELLDELKEYFLPGYATGGFPEDGLFMANSGELVGKFTNGRTAVANNEQIIEGIKRGVKEANMESGGNGGDWIIQLVDTDGRVKSETIISATERRNRRDGKTIIPVGT